MSDTAIEWTHRPGTRGATWNPTVGCTETSPGCKHCYAKGMHKRLTAMGQAKYAEPFHVVRPYPLHLDLPLRTKRPTTYFVNSMSDLFHEDLPNEYIAAVFGVMAACPQHTFQVLTKRAERLAAWFSWHAAQVAQGGDGMRYQTWRVCEDAAREHLPDLPASGTSAPWPLPNVWLGVSVENQDYAEARIPHLLKVPAQVRFLSCEPLLGELALMKWLRLSRFEDHIRSLQTEAEQHGPIPEHLRWSGRRPPCLHWVIVGGESGGGARPLDVAAARKVVKDCEAAGVPVFVKQLGAYVRDRNDAGFDGQECDAWDVHGEDDRDEHDLDGTRDGYQGAPVRIHLRSKKGSDPTEWPADLRMRQYPPTPEETR